ncbi:hypothetical protein D3C75_1127100 [compost metagenome]
MTVLDVVQRGQGNGGFALLMHAASYVVRRIALIGILRGQHTAVGTNQFTAVLQE